MIAAVAIDTNAYSAFRRGLPSMVEVFSRVPRIVVPLAVLAELLAGAAVGRLAERNRTDLAKLLASPRVSLALPDRQTAENYATVFQQLRTAGHPIPTNDIWIAATAIQDAIPLITLDSRFRFVASLRSASGLAELLGAER